MPVSRVWNVYSLWFAVILGVSIFRVYILSSQHIVCAHSLNLSAQAWLKCHVVRPRDLWEPLWVISLRPVLHGCAYA